MQAVYINLDGADDRRAFMELQARRLGLALTRFRAITAADASDEEFSRSSRQWERPITRNEHAAFLSHRALWGRAAASPDGLVILEDDAVLSPRFGATVGRLPGGFDLINLETVGRRKFFARDPSFLADTFRVTQVVRDKSGAGAYFLSPAGAKKLLRLSETHVAPVDAFMFAVAPLRIGQVEPALTMQVHLLAERGIDAGLVTRTSIHAPRRRLRPELRNLPFFWRRTATQIALLGVQARRFLDLDFRDPEFDEAEFRAILPVRPDGIA